MSEKFPAQGYKDNVLSECFADAKEYLLEHYLDVDRAHILMLGEQDIVTRGELSEILRAIEKLNVARFAAQSTTAALKICSISSSERLLQKSGTRILRENFIPPAAGTILTLLFIACASESRHWT